MCFFLQNREIFILTKFSSDSRKDFLTIEGPPFRENICVSKNVIASILFLWVIFAFLGRVPDPLALFNADPVRIRIHNIQTFRLVKFFPVYISKNSVGLILTTVTPSFSDRNFFIFFLYLTSEHELVFI